MQAREKKLLLIAGGMFLLYVLPVVLYPAVKNWVQDFQSGIEQDQNEIARLQRLQAQVEQWQSEHRNALRLQEEINNGLLSGTTRELVGGQLHSILNALAAQTKIKVTSVDLTEFAETGDWLLVTKALKFEASSRSLLNFINAIQGDPARLYVVNLDVRVVRKDRVNGEIKVTGFSPSIQADADTQEG